MMDENSNFVTLRAGFKAATVTAEAEEMPPTDILVVARTNFGNGQIQAGSLSDLTPDEHLNLLADATMRFAATIGREVRVVELTPETMPKGEG